MSELFYQIKQGLYFIRGRVWVQLWEKASKFVSHSLGRRNLYDRACFKYYRSRVFFLLR